MSVKQRLIKFLKYENLSQKRFAELVGVSDGYVNAIKVSIQPKTIRKIAMQFPHLNTGWLLTGDGGMLKKNQSDLDNVAGIVAESVPNYEKNIRMTEKEEKGYFQLIEAVTRLTNTVESQQETIRELLRLKNRSTAPQEDNAGNAAAV